MICQRCRNLRVISIIAHCNDCCLVSSPAQPQGLPGYQPCDIGLGKNSDHIKMSWCLDCGQIQGKWPIPKAQVETEFCAYCQEDPGEAITTWDEKPICDDCLAGLQK
jgi:hypothetical protein